MYKTFEETWMYQEMIHRSLSKELAQGRKQGRIEVLRWAITRYVEKRYPELTSLAQQQTMSIEAYVKLVIILDNLIDAQTVDEARHILLTIEQQTSQTNS